MNIILGADHAGYALKDCIADHLRAAGHTVEDIGCNGPQSVDYPYYGKRVAHAVAGGHYDMGIIVCGTGIGISMAANRVKGARAALCTSEYMAELTRRHNDANILALGARVVGEGLALSIVDTFTKTPFEGDRHQRRIDQIESD